jgi:hypothetical protein
MRRASISSPDYADLASRKPYTGSTNHIGARRTSPTLVCNTFVLTLMTAPAYAIGFRFHAGPAAALGVGVAMSWIFALLGLPVPTNCGRRLGTAAEAPALVSRCRRVARNALSGWARRGLSIWRCRMASWWRSSRIWTVLVYVAHR